MRGSVPYALFLKYFPGAWCPSCFNHTSIFRKLSQSQIAYMKKAGVQTS